MHNCIQDIVHVAQGRTGMKENSDQSITRLEEGSGNPRLLVRDLLADPRLELQLVAGSPRLTGALKESTCRNWRIPLPGWLPGAFFFPRASTLPAMWRWASGWLRPCTAAKWSAWLLPLAITCLRCLFP